MCQNAKKKKCMEKTGNLGINKVHAENLKKCINESSVEIRNSMSKKSWKVFLELEWD